jgi:hypothetical protein
LNILSSLQRYFNGSMNVNNEIHARIDGIDGIGGRNDGLLLYYGRRIVNEMVNSTNKFAFLHKGDERCADVI